MDFSISPNPEHRFRGEILIFRETSSLNFLRPKTMKRFFHKFLFYRDTANLKNLLVPPNSLTVNSERPLYRG